MKFNHDKINKWLVITFVMLYVSVGFVSTYHAVSFFSIANQTWLAVVLACAFEVGQATVLFSLIVSDRKRGRLSHWLMMIALTTVQVMGNVFASYQYLSEHNIKSIEYFSQSVLFFMPELDPVYYKVALVWVIGAILPIIALGMAGTIAGDVADEQEPITEKKESDKLELELNKEEHKEPDIKIPKEGKGFWG